MRKLTVKFALLGLVTALQINSVQAYPLVKDVNVVQPVRSKFVNDQLLTDLYILPDYSEAAMHRLIQSVKRNVGRDNKKKIRIFWNDKTSQESAVKIQQILLAGHLKQKNISLQKDPSKKAIYPLYVEVQHIAPRKTNCFSDVDGKTAHPNACATKSNHRIHLNN